MCKVKSCNGVFKLRQNHDERQVFEATAQSQQLPRQAQMNYDEHHYQPLLKLLFPDDPFEFATNPLATVYSAAIDSVQESVK